MSEDRHIVASSLALVLVAAMVFGATPLQAIGLAAAVGVVGWFVWSMAAL